MDHERVARPASARGGKPWTVSGGWDDGYWMPDDRARVSRGVTKLASLSWAEPGPGPGELQDRDRGGGELCPHPVQGLGWRSAGASARSGCCQRERQVLDRWIMPDHQEGRHQMNQVQQPGRRCLVHAALEVDRRGGSQPGLRKLPRLAGTHGGGAQHMVRHAASIAQPAPSGGSVPAGKLPLMIRHIRPGRLGMPQQHQSPAWVCCHGHSFAGAPVGCLPVSEPVAFSRSLAERACGKAEVLGRPAGRREHGTDRSARPGGILVAGAGDADGSFVQQRQDVIECLLAACELPVPLRRVIGGGCPQRGGGPQRVL